MGSHNHARKSLRSPVTANITVQGTLPGATPTDGPSEGLQMGEHWQEEFNGPRGLCQATIDKLPDDVLIEIFDFYLDKKNIVWPRDWDRSVDEWHTLVHVCKKWRNVVFASPRRLDLRLLCKNTRRVTMLGIWPVLPINIEGVLGKRWGTGMDNIVAALDHHDRVRTINLIYAPGPQEGLHPTAMQARFPELTELRFSGWGLGEHFLPDSFLGGSAPRLRTLWLRDAPFPAAPNLLLSASGLVHLRLDRIPHSGYIPPTSMVACLSSLNKLESLLLGFLSPRSRPDQPSPPPQSRVVIPALIRLVFDGMSEYSEDLVAHIDTPVLNQLHMTFFRNPIFDLRHLKEFIGRGKELKPSKAAEFRFSSLKTPLSIHLDLQEPHSSSSSSMGVRRDSWNWQVYSLALLCGQVSHLFSLVERLDLPPASPPWDDTMVSIQFLELFRLFTATRSLYVPENLGPLIASALQKLIGERATEVLPNLRDIFLERSAESGSIQEVIQPFVDSRRLSGQPVTA